MQKFICLKSLIHQLARFLECSGEDERDALCDKWGDPDSVRSGNLRKEKNRQRFQHNAPADGNDIGRACSFGRKQKCGVDQVVRHGNKGQRKQRQGCRGGLYQLRLFIENTDHRHIKEKQVTVNGDGQNCIDDHAAAEIPVHFGSIFSAVALSPEGLQTLRHAGQNRVSQRVDETQHTEGGHADISDQACQHQVIAQRRHRRGQLGDRLRHAAFTDLPDKCEIELKCLDPQIPLFP